LWWFVSPPTASLLTWDFHSIQGKQPAFYRM